MGPVRHNQPSGSALHERSKLYRDLQARNIRQARLMEARNRARIERVLRLVREHRKRHLG